MSESLRLAVLSGRFFGRGGVAEDLSAFLAEGRVAHALACWFGVSALSHLDATRLGEAIDRDIVTLDRLISAQLDTIMHHERLTRLEGSWRGLDWLVHRSTHDRLVKMRLLSITWQEVARDLERAVEFDQSNLFRLIYEAEFGSPGGEPYGLIAADFPIHGGPGPRHPVDDVMVLGHLAGVAAASFCPIILPAAPSLFGLDSFHEVQSVFAFDEALRAPERARWHNLGQREDTRFLALVLPRTLGRPLWQDDGTRADRFRYRERGAEPGQRVWTSPIYAMAGVAVRAFQRFRWPAEIRGAEPGQEASGGVVEDLPHERFRADPPGPPARPPLELALTDDQERQLADVSVIPLCGLESLPEATFGAVPMLHQPPQMTGAAGANQRMSAQLNTLLCVSRFTHALKLMGRDMVGSFAVPEDMELRLQQWLNRYVSGLAGGGDVAARYPLRDAKVEVRERPGRPGIYGCTIHLQPQYQLDEVGATFRLVTELRASRATA